MSINKTKTVIAFVCSFFLLLTCSRHDTLYNPSGQGNYKLDVYAADTTGIPSNISKDSIQSILKTQLSTIPGEPITLFGFITGDTSKVTPKWNFGDGKDTTGTILVHTYDTTGTFHAVFSITDKEGVSISDTVAITVIKVNGSAVRGNAKYQGKSSHSGIYVVLVDKVHKGNSAVDSTKSSGSFRLDSLVINSTYDIVFYDSTYHNAFSPCTLHDISIKEGVQNVLPAVTLHDNHPPHILGNKPSGILDIRQPAISANFIDTGSGISPRTFVFTINRRIIPDSIMKIDTAGLSYMPAQRLPDGVYALVASIQDSAGNEDTLSWSFKVDAMKLAILTPDTTVRINDTIRLRSMVSNVYSKVVIYKWDFDGNGTWDDSLATADTLVSRSHVYTHDTVYRAIEYVRDDSGMVKLDTVTINIGNLPPVISSIRPDTTISIKDSIRLFGAAHDPDGTIKEYAWDFNGDGTFDYTSVTQIQAGYRYNTAGVYTAILRVTDDDNKKSYDTAKITVLQDAPVVTASTPDTLVSIKDTIHLHASATVHSGTIAMWEWDFGNTGKFVVTSKGDTAVIAPATATQAYVCVVRATDSKGNTSTATVTIKILEDAPVVTTSTPDTLVSIKDTIHMHASATVHSGTIVKWEWDCGNTGKFVTTTKGDTAVIAPAEATQAHVCVVRVTDSKGNTSTATVTIKVLLDAPVITFFSSDTIVDHGGSVRCSVYVQQQFGTMVVEIDTANSGNFKNLGGLGLSGGKSYSFSTGNACAWDSVKVRITDDDGNVVIKGFKVQVRISPPVIQKINPDTTIAVKDSVIFYLSAIDTFGSITQVAWDFDGNGVYDWTSSTIQNAGYRYPTAGIYKAVLRLTDECLKLTYDTVKVTVLQDFPVPNVGSDTTVSIKDTIKLHGSAAHQFGTITEWAWDIGNTGTFKVTSTGDTNIIAPAVQNLNYLCIFRVTDNHGNVAKDTVKITVLQDAPIAIAGKDTTVGIRDTIRLHGSAKQQFGSIVEWAWKLGDGPWTTSSGADTILIAASAAGVYPCSLRVVDDDGNKGYNSILVSVYSQFFGDINKDTILLKSGNPFVVKNNIRVLPGIKLNVQSGVQMRFYPNATISVYGSLSANGSPADSIIFSPYKDTTFWGGVHICHSSACSCTLSYCAISYANYGIFCDSANPIINKCTISHNSIGITWGGWISSAPKILYSLISNNNTGMHFDMGSPYIKNCFIMNNIGTGIELQTTDSLQLFNSVIEGNNVGISFFTLTSTHIIDSCFIAYNSTSGIQMNEGGGTITYSTIQYNGNGAVNNIDTNKIAGISVASGFSISNLVLKYNDISYNRNGIVFCNANTSGDSLGNNDIYNNSLFNFKVQTGIALSATNNWWGTIDTTIINTKILDQSDDFTLGQLIYLPYLSSQLGLSWHP